MTAIAGWTVYEEYACGLLIKAGSVVLINPSVPDDFQRDILILCMCQHNPLHSIQWGQILT